MARQKYNVGDQVEVRCDHRADGGWANDWTPGVVVQADYRMAAVRLSCDVKSSNGWVIPDRTLWLAHGSKNLRPALNKQSS